MKTQNYLFLIKLFFLTIIINLLSNNYTFSQSTDKDSLNIFIKKTVSAQKATQAIKIDGKLNDLAWQNAETVSDFKTFEPDINKTPSQKTEVKILYDNDAIYVAARMYDTAPDSILRELGVRDAISANADYFGVFFDTYDDDQNGFSFVVSASNIQSDAKYSSFGEDWNWNGVWYSKALTDEEGWTVEMRIPYFTLRFPKQDLQNWGLNFWRQVRRHRERSAWSPFNPAQDGFVVQFGELTGLEGIEPPLRLSVTPYISTYADFYTDPSDKSNNSNNQTIRGGMDLKYGINESFTLDMALIPDFGQVQSDDQILNLGPFEVFFNENRPFFTEGIELFNKGGIFYSRRVGGRPQNYYAVEDEVADNEELTNNPTASQLYNATKISGRTANNIGIGFFNAVTGNTYATIENIETKETRQSLINPLTNYNMIVVEKAFKNSSYLSFVNSNVMRAGNFKDANVTGTEFEFANKTQTYSIGGKAVLSQIFDRSESEKALLGHAYRLRLGKIKGKFKYNFTQNVESDTYDPNDLGFLSNPNEFTNILQFRYNEFKPFSIFNNLFSNLNFVHSMLYKPFEYSSFEISGQLGVTLKNFTTTGIYFETNPIEGQNWFSPRQEGRFFVTEAYTYLHYFISTDYRKKFALDIGTGYGMGKRYKSRLYNINISPRLRVNDRLSFVHRINANNTLREVDYATTLDNENEDIIYGTRHRQTISNQLQAKYIFTSKMGINLRARHYWSKVAYDELHVLQDDGNIGQTDHTGDYNNSFNAFTLDCGYTWEFTPGSMLSFFWRNNIFLYQDNEATDYTLIDEKTYFNNISDTFAAPQLNSFSLRLLYFLDYGQTFGKNKKKAAI